jgi:hypothetical protein
MDIQNDGMPHHPHRRKSVMELAQDVVNQELQAMAPAVARLSDIQRESNLISKSSATLCTSVDTSTDFVLPSSVITHDLLDAVAATVTTVITESDTVPVAVTAAASDSVVTKDTDPGSESIYRIADCDENTTNVVNNKVDVESADCTILQFEHERKLATKLSALESNRRKSVLLDDAVPYHRQGDASYYTPLALEQRAKLINDSRIVVAISLLFRVYQTDQRGFVDEVEYRRAHLNYSRALLVPFDMDEASNNASHDWIGDRRNTTEDNLAPEDCFTSIFEIADIWTDTVEPKDYVRFLVRLYLRVTKPTDEHGNRGWREMHEVRSLVDDDGELIEEHQDIEDDSHGIHMIHMIEMMIDDHVASDPLQRALSNSNGASHDAAAMRHQLSLISASLNQSGGVQQVHNTLLRQFNAAQSTTVTSNESRPAPEQDKHSDESGKLSSAAHHRTDSSSITIQARKLYSEADSNRKPAQKKPARKSTVSRPSARGEELHVTIPTASELSSGSSSAPSPYSNADDAHFRSTSNDGHDAEVREHVHRPPQHRKSGRKGACGNNIESEHDSELSVYPEPAPAKLKTAGKSSSRTTISDEDELARPKHHQRHRRYSRRRRNRHHYHSQAQLAQPRQKPQLSEYEKNLVCTPDAMPVTAAARRLMGRVSMVVNLDPTLLDGVPQPHTSMIPHIDDKVASGNSMGIRSRQSWPIPKRRVSVISLSAGLNADINADTSCKRSTIGRVRPSTAGMSVRQTRFHNTMSRCSSAAASRHTKHQFPQSDAQQQHITVVPAPCSVQHDSNLHHSDACRTLDQQTQQIGSVEWNESATGAASDQKTGLGDLPVVRTIPTQTVALCRDGEVDKKKSSKAKAACLPLFQTRFSTRRSQRQRRPATSPVHRQHWEKDHRNSGATPWQTFAPSAGVSRCAHIVRCREEDAMVTSAASSIALERQRMQVSVSQQKSKQESFRSQIRLLKQLHSSASHQQATPLVHSDEQGNAIADTSHRAVHMLPCDSPGIAVSFSRRLQQPLPAPALSASASVLACNSSCPTKLRDMTGTFVKGTELHRTAPIATTQSQPGTLPAEKTTSSVSVQMPYATLQEKIIAAFETSEVMLGSIQVTTNEMAQLCDSPAAKKRSPVVITKARFDDLHRYRQPAMQVVAYDQLQPVANCKNTISPLDAHALSTVAMPTPTATVVVSAAEVEQVSESESEADNLFDMASDPDNLNNSANQNQRMSFVQLQPHSIQSECSAQTPYRPSSSKAAERIYSAGNAMGSMQHVRSVPSLLSNGNHRRSHQSILHRSHNCSGTRSRTCRRRHNRCRTVPSGSVQPQRSSKRTPSRRRRRTRRRRKKKHTPGTVSESRPSTATVSARAVCPSVFRFRSHLKLCRSASDGALTPVREAIGKTDLQRGIEELKRSRVRSAFLRHGFRLLPSRQSTSSAGHRPDAHCHPGTSNH